MQISTLIGKPILSPAGDALGYVTDVRPSRDYKKIACIVGADAEEEEFYLPLSALRAVSDAVIAGKSRLTSPAGILSPIGKRAYSEGGEFLGGVCDVMLGEDPSFLISKDNTADMVPVSFVSVGETVIVYASEEARAAARRKAKKPAAPRLRRREVPHRPGEEPCEDLPDVVPPLKEPDPHSPPAEPPAPKGIFDRTNLLGRYVRRPVYDNRGKPIALTGDLVTPSLLSTARRAGKLLALTVNTLTNC